MALVFQYGSNTSSRRMNGENRLRGEATDLGLCRTAGHHELSFDVWSTLGGYAASNLVAREGRHAWGVLYQIPDYLMSRKTSGNRRSMDAIEGRSYARVPIELCWSDGTPVQEAVITYTVRQPQVGLLTTLEYATHIIAGLREHAAPADYIEFVKERVRLNNPALAAGLGGL